MSSSAGSRPLACHHRPAWAESSSQITITAESSQAAALVDLVNMDIETGKS